MDIPMKLKLYDDIINHEVINILKAVFENIFQELLKIYFNLFNMEKIRFTVKSDWAKKILESTKLNISKKARKYLLDISIWTYRKEKFFLYDFDDNKLECYFAEKYSSYGILKTKTFNEFYEKSQISSIPIPSKDLFKLL